MAKKRRQFAFQHIATVGHMLPADVLERVANEDSKLPGLRPSEYGLAADSPPLSSESGHFGRLGPVAAILT